MDEQFCFTLPGLGEITFITTSSAVVEYRIEQKGSWQAVTMFTYLWANVICATVLSTMICSAYSQEWVEHRSFGIYLTK
jgi:hypothetical protein